LFLLNSFKYWENEIVLKSQIITIRHYEDHKEKNKNELQMIQIIWSTAIQMFNFFDNTATS